MLNYQLIKTLATIDKSNVALSIAIELKIQCLFARFINTLVEMVQRDGFLPRECKHKFFIVYVDRHDQGFQRMFVVGGELCGYVIIKNVRFTRKDHHPNCRFNGHIQGE